MLKKSTIFVNCEQKVSQWRRLTKTIKNIIAIERALILILLSFLFFSFYHAESETIISGTVRERKMRYQLFSFSFLFVYLLKKACSCRHTRFHMRGFIINIIEIVTQIHR